MGINGRYPKVLRTTGIRVVPDAAFGWCHWSPPSEAMVPGSGRATVGPVYVADERSAI